MQAVVQPHIIATIIIVMKDKELPCVGGTWYYGSDATVVLDPEQRVVGCDRVLRRAVNKEGDKLMETKMCTKCNRELPLTEFR